MRFLWALKQQFRFLFLSTGVQNAQLFENSVLEYKRNQILLNLARSIFEEQNNLECLVTKIMKEARDLLKCERCAVFLVDLECCEEVIPFFSSSSSSARLVIDTFQSQASVSSLFLSLSMQSHLERMVKSTNQIDYDESNKADNDAKKVNK